ncbi:hypothetical protein QBC37DRAFT_430183 [Rhypophila decipiens]|uniref:Uncharacterized protein n=1 Tax=Rhypophila decipiens TaxID=261697 RepID=A0AAN7B3H0_9PEZI|nr:hypothetical protein QBC37DRAFT_430183 [Rhypophila decipiens]
MCCFKCLVGCLDRPKKNKSQKHQTSSNGNAGGAPPYPGKQDFVDKAVSGFVGNKVKPETVEKMTDGARGMFEKRTGHKVPGFISN